MYALSLSYYRSFMGILFNNFLAGSDVVSDILEVFTSVAEWFASIFQVLIPMFWVPETGLTFLGFLAVAALAISVILLITNIIQNFLHFRS